MYLKNQQDRSLSNRKIFNESTLTAWKEVDSMNWQEIVCEITGIYFEFAPKQFLLLRESVVKRDLNAIRIAAHTLKSSCGNVGAELAHQILDQIEKQAEAMQEGEIQNLLMSFEPVFAQSQAEIREFLTKLHAA